MGAADHLLEPNFLVSFTIFKYFYKKFQLWYLWGDFKVQKRGIDPPCTPKEPEMDQLTFQKSILTTQSLFLRGQTFWWEWGGKILLLAPRLMYTCTLVYVRVLWKMATAKRKRLTLVEKYNKYNSQSDGSFLLKI